MVVSGKGNLPELPGWRRHFPQGRFDEVEFMAFEHTIEALINKSRGKKIVEVVQVLENTEYNLLSSSRRNSRLGVVRCNRRRGEY